MPRQLRGYYFVEGEDPLEDDDEEDDGLDLFEIQDTDQE